VTGPHKRLRTRLTGTQERRFARWSGRGGIFFARGRDVTENMRGRGKHNKPNSKKKANNGTEESTVGRRNIFAIIGANLLKSLPFREKDGTWRPWGGGDHEGGWSGENVNGEERVSSLEERQYGHLPLKGSFPSGKGEGVPSIQGDGTRGGGERSETQGEIGHCSRRGPPFTAIGRGGKILECKKSCPPVVEKASDAKTSDGSLIRKGGNSRHGGGRVQVMGSFRPGEKEKCQGRRVQMVFRGVYLKVGRVGRALIKEL